jgi:hypothetical protein
MAEILPLAFAAAVYPTLLAGVILILARPAPKPLLVGFLAGGWFLSVLSGLLVVFVLEGAVSTSSRQSSSPYVDLVAGILSVGLAAVLWRRRTAPPRARASRDRRHGRKSRDRSGTVETEPFTQRVLARSSPRAAFALGMLLNVPGVWYLIALKDIATANRGAAAAVVLIIVFNLIMFLLAEVPLVGYLVDPIGTRARVDRFESWLKANSRTVSAGVALAIGIYLTIKGAVNI